MGKIETAPSREYSWLLGEDLSGDLTELLAFDSSIEQRVNDIKRGLSPNGHSPNGVLSDAMPGVNDEAVAIFTAEYRWAEATASFPYRTQERKDDLMCAADDALFDARSSYDTAVEPNFLIHYSRIARELLHDIYGPAPAWSKISIENFDEVVISEHLRKAPPLANRQQPEDLETGGLVYTLDTTGMLVPARVESVHAYSNEHVLGPPPPEAVLNELQAAIDKQTEDGMDWSILEGATSLIGGLRQNNLRYNGGSPSAKTLWALGYITLPDYPQLISNPSPGFVSLSMNSDPYKLITDINHNYIIPPRAWEQIRRDKLYRMAWLASGSVESLRRRDVLERAIGRAINEWAVADMVESGSNRELCEPHRDYLAQAAQAHRIRPLPIKWLSLD